MDSFSELLQSSIDYAESTTHHLQPSKLKPLNKELLQKVKIMIEDAKDKQAWKASGVSKEQSEGAWQ